MARGRRGTGIPVDPQRVRNARLDAGLTLAAVAGTEVSRTFIHQIERGASRPSAQVLELIARRTHKPMDYFAPGNKRFRITSAELSDELARALDMVTELTATGRLKTSARVSMKSIAESLRRAAALTKVLKGSGSDRIPSR